ncbi:unnamed protein product [Linum trigynum]|uniref:RNase H type-1 domain-containing protein n=1 Tax=Linum trigynum TaxID=586398 RepID=A0AAV2EMX4_9ROSI
MFLDCPVARALWDHSGLAHLGEGLPRHTFPLFLKKLLALIHQPIMVMSVIAVLWRIWQSRNWVVFEGKQFGIPVLMRQYNQQVQEWVNLPVDKTLPVHQSPSPPSDPTGSNSVLCMWDGAIRNGSHSAGGMVIMTSAREVLLVKGVSFPGMDDPMLAEMLVLREAIVWCVGNGFTAVRFEGDAQVIIEKILQRDTRDNRVGSILEEVVQAFDMNRGFSVRFVGRRNIRVAHLVARKALYLYPTTCRLSDFQAWLNSRM